MTWLALLELFNFLCCLGTHRNFKLKPYPPLIPVEEPQLCPYDHEEVYPKLALENFEVEGDDNSSAATLPSPSALDSEWWTNNKTVHTEERYDYEEECAIIIDEHGFEHTIHLL